MKVLVTGATGLIGRALCRSLAADAHSVIALSRSPATAGLSSVSQTLAWSPLSGPPPPESLSGVDAVVHLAGEPVAGGRWSNEQKKKIRDSRVVSTKNLVAGMRSASSKPAVFVSGSAIGYYGDRGDESLDETSAPGDDFLAHVCQEWEAEARRATDLPTRVVLLRTGVVLSRDGGALTKMVTPFKLGIGGNLGSGRQWLPWAHIADIVGIIRHALATAGLNGPVNGVAPGVVTNAEFTAQLARVLHRPAFLPVPAFALRALVGEMADVLLGGQRAVPQAALKSGYEFHFPLLEAALEDLLGQQRTDGG